MKNYANRFKIALLFLGDLFVLYLTLWFLLWLRYWPGVKIGLLELHFFSFSILFPVWLVILAAFGFYDLRQFRLGSMTEARRFLLRLGQALAINFFLAILFFYFIPQVLIEPRRNLAFITILAGLALFAWRYLADFLFLKTTASKILFFGLNREVTELSDYLLKNPQLGQKPVSIISADGKENESDKNLTRLIHDFGADTIVITPEIKENSILTKFLLQVLPLGVTIAEFTNFYETTMGKIPLSLIKEIWFLENLVGLKKPVYEFFKRAADIALAVLLLVPIIAVAPLIALAIKLNSPGRIFFWQKRVGRGGKEFWLIKFRSMTEGAEKAGGYKENAGGKDPRHTAVGQFLRRNYLDELPQILNILKSEMSFIGPRPERPEFVEKLKEEVPFYEMRLLVTPGITGWAQINMENDASVEDAPEKMQYDLYYIKNLSFWLDLLIMARTFFTLLRRQGR
ncbi:MAG: sugar transferase [bacterium]|nr:sugar transferase [bacterium]